MAEQRIDSSVDTHWSVAAPPVAGLPAHTPFMTRWTGWLTLPPGTWELGGLTTGGMRVYLNGSAVYNDWTGGAAAADPSYGTTTVSGGAQYQVEVDNWEPYTAGQPEVHLWAQDTAITNPNTPSAFVVPSDWLSPIATGVPPGWSLQASGTAVQWTRADDEGQPGRPFQPDRRQRDLRPDRPRGCTCRRSGTRTTSRWTPTTTCSCPPAASCTRSTPTAASPR